LYNLHQTTIIMKSQRKTWEIILAGCALTALSIYVMNPVPATTSHPNQQKLHQETAVQKTISIEMEQAQQELKEAQKELEAASLELEQLSLPSVPKLPEIVTSSN